MRNLVTRWVLALALVAVGASHARATSGRYVDVTCPVCGNAFEAWEFRSTNNFAGMDRDLCEHAAGDQVFLLALATCPKCLYTAFVPDFAAEAVTDEVKGRLRKEGALRPAAPIDPATRRTTEIPAWIRWDLYGQVLEVRGDASAGRRANAHLDTGRTQRFDFAFPDAIGDAVRDLAVAYQAAPKGVEGAPRRSGYDEAVDAAKALEADAADATLRLSPTERRHRLLAAACLYKHRGEDPEVVRVLAAWRASQEEIPEPERALTAELEQRVARERAAMERAVPLLEEAAKGAGDDGADPRVLRYLLGEVSRKLGRADEALGWLEPLLAAEDLPQGFRSFVEEALRKTKAAAPR